MVRALFAVAGCMQPAVIFVDEIDSILSARKSEGIYLVPQSLDTRHQSDGSATEQVKQQLHCTFNCFLMTFQPHAAFRQIPGIALDLSSCGRPTLSE